MIRRGEVYWVDFKGSFGAEIRKIRPAVVVSCDDINEFLSTVIVAPLSSAPELVPKHDVAVPPGTLGDGRPARIKPHQVRAVDKKRLKNKIGMLQDEAMFRLEDVLAWSLGLPRPGEGA